MSDFVPGVHAIPEAEYHAIPAVGSSGIRWLAISPMDFWARTPWLNPKAGPSEETEFTELGTAYHERILRGPEAFTARYAPALDLEDYPDALVTADDLKEACRDHGLKISGSKGELVERLREANLDVAAWEAILAEHALSNAGKILLPGKRLAHIEIAAAMIERHPDLSRCFQGGIPELAVVWVDEETGVPCKARIDYLKPKAMIELKSFSNSLGKSIDEAIYSAIAGRRYFVQAAHYLSAWPHLRKAVEEGRVYGDIDADLLFLTEDEPTWVWVFQQTGPAPLARGKLFPAGVVRDIGNQIVRQALETFARCKATFGTDPWVDDRPIEALDDMGFPAWIGR